MVLDYGIAPVEEDNVEKAQVMRKWAFLQMLGIEFFEKEAY